MDNGALLLGPFLVALTVIGIGLVLGLLGVIVFALNRAVGVGIDALAARVRAFGDSRRGRARLR